MEKPASLRAAIEKSLPEIGQSPEKFAMFVGNGRIRAYKATLSHTVEFTLSVLITDFTGNLDVLHTTVVHWLQTNQPDILGPGDTDPAAYSFEADILANDRYDILIELKLSERTRALVDDQGSVQIDHPGEPQHKQDLTGILGLGG